ncbi:hypothetical protein SAMN04488128_101236 [Chitinophaga eiseniae]|uniref:Uncharacterized protein n=1 Tax=Chitinophaga eiseniae TaxID=634771 RepID=A0A1T4KPF8_9BACT|nr:hypothetical protein [Chitinophaga eiseniae]SJZ44274.1 hypothetical protein SAMN04488128_101236 [Chitinophaga eiseniae]
MNTNKSSKPIKARIDVNASLAEVEECLLGFFRAIDDGDAKRMWEHMSEAFRSRALQDNHIARYRKIFQTENIPISIGLSSINIQSRTQIDCIADCEINVGRLTSLKGVSFTNRALENIGEIGHLIQIRIDQMREIDPVKAEEMIQRVSIDFDIIEGKYYWTAFRINTSDVSGLILDSFKDLVMRSFKFFFVLTDGVWLVDNVILLSEKSIPKEEE